MEAFFIFVLIVGFIAVLIRQSQLNGRLRELEELYQRLLRSQPQMPVAPVQLPAAPRPVPVAPAVVPAPPSMAKTAEPPVAAQQSAPSAAAPYTYRPTYVPPSPNTIPPPTFTAAVPVREPKPHISLEARLGQNWLNKLGITAMVVGIACYLGYELQHVGPLGKSLAGLAIALGILGLGVFLERKAQYRVFARACLGGGWALLFFLSFAIYHLPLLQVLHSSLADLVLMMLVAAGMVTHSLRYRSQTVTTLAFFLALLTVGISDVTVFSLVAGALLTAALAVIVARERWFLLGLFGVIGVYLNHFLWLHRVLPQGGRVGHPFAEFVPSAALLLAYWLTFRLVYVFRAPLADGEGVPDYRQQQGVAGSAAILNSVGLLALLKYQSSHPEWAFAGLLAFGTVELVLALVARVSIKGKPRNRPAFVVLSTLASVMLLAAVPFRFQGASWSLLWLLEAEALFVAGIRLPEVVFRRLGVLASLATGALLALGGFVILAAGDAVVKLPAAPHHPALVLMTAALVLWVNAEVMTRLRPTVAEGEFDGAALRVGSYAAGLLAVLGLTIAFTGNYAWIAVAWLVLSRVLSEVGDRAASRDLTVQGDLIALAAVVRVVAVNLAIDPHKTTTMLGVGVSLQLLTVGIGAALLYAGARRKADADGFGAVAQAAYTWVAGALVATLCWYQLSAIWLAVAWGGFAVVLFEVGLRARKSYLRQQAFALLAAGFVRVLVANLNWVSGDLPHPAGTLSPAVYTVVPLIAVFAWVYERAQRSEEATAFDKLAGTLAAWGGLIAAGSLLYTEVRAEWVMVAWTLMAIAVLALAAALKREMFVAQAFVVLAGVLVRGLGVLFLETPAAGFVHSRWFTVGMSCALLLAALPVAFAVRRHAEGLSSDVLAPLLRRPEQPFFFVPLLLLTLLLYVQLSGGAITMGWVGLGLATFLFALAVKERSYRLSGLGLLLLGVAKVLAWDVWHAPPAERYLTLILMGAALLLVSFLYSRYKETLLKLL